VQDRRVTIVKAAVTRLGRITVSALVIAAAGGAALVVAAFLAPMYASTSVSSSGEVIQGSATLVGVNGMGVLVVVGLPLLVSVAVGCLLWLSLRRGAVAAAWTLTGVLAAFTLLAMLSIGAFVLPVTAALVVACVASRSTRSEAVGHPAGAGLGPVSGTPS
jgi:hypothetical protein